jgi:hypothetical protein
MIDATATTPEPTPDPELNSPDPATTCPNCGGVRHPDTPTDYACVSCGHTEPTPETETETETDPDSRTAAVSAGATVTAADLADPTGDEFGDITGGDVAALLRLGKVKQSAVATAANTSQGTVSRRIAGNDLADPTGRDIRRAAVRLAIESAGAVACRTRLASNPLTAVRATPAATPTAAALNVSPSVTVQSVDIPTADIRDFDSSLFKVATMLRRSIEQGDARMSFGLRKLVNAKRSYMHFRRAGFDTAAAAAAAFYVAVSAREYGETEKITVESYRAVFTSAAAGGVADPGSILKHATDLPGSEFDLPNEHPAFRLIRPILDAGENMWIHGPTGGGKTYGVAEHFRTRRGVRPIRMQCNANTVHAHIVGTFGLRAENGATVTIFHHAAIPHAMSAAIRGDDGGGGLPVIIDEISLADSGALMTLQAVLEGEPLLISENGGETVFPDPGFQVVACDNTRGLGEAAAYVATLPVNEAFRDRFLFCEVGYSPNEKSILKATA